MVNTVTSTRHAATERLPAAAPRTCPWGTSPDARKHPAVSAPTLPRPALTSAAGASTARSARVWWLSPVAVLLMVVPLACLATAFISDETFRDQWRSPKTITFGTCMLLLAAGLTVALGAALVASVRPVRPREGRWPSLTPNEVRVLERASTVLIVLTVIGYLSFVVLAASSGLSLQRVVASFGSEGLYGGDIKKGLGTIAGVTTLTQAGIASSVVSALLLAQKTTRRQVIRLVGVFVLALPRAFLLTERLAILEVIVPVIVVFALRAAANPRGQRVVSAIPLVAAPVVVVVFASFEYFRSWVFYRDRTDLSFPRWAFERFIGYYSTSLNNGALEMTYNTYPGRWPYDLMGAFWSAPGIDSAGLYQKLTGVDNAVLYKSILTDYGNPEFNNSSGLATAFVDLGLAGGLLFLFGVGLVLGLMYRSFRESRPLGLIAYPMLFTGIVELSRTFEWTKGRLVPAVLAAVVIAILLRRAGRLRPTA